MPGWSLGDMHDQDIDLMFGKKKKVTASRSRACPGAILDFAHGTLLLPIELQWGKLRGAAADVQHIILVALAVSALHLQQTNPHMTKAQMTNQIKLHDTWWMLFTFLCPKVSVHLVNNFTLIWEPLRNIKPLLQSFSSSFVRRPRHLVASCQVYGGSFAAHCKCIARHVPQWTLNTAFISVAFLFKEGMLTLNMFTLHLENIHKLSF